jgi:hypothetical protein
MNENDLRLFLRRNQFVPSPEHSIPEAGMSSKVDAFISGDVLLRVVVDRGQQFIDLARVGSNLWRDVFALSSAIDPTFRVETGSFSEAIGALTQHWPRITHAL